MPCLSARPCCIPTDQNNPTGKSTPTPVPFPSRRSIAIQLWMTGCGASPSQETTLDNALENLSAQLSLLSADGGLVAAQDAIPPLNVLPPHTSLPLTAFFPSPAPVGRVAACPDFCRLSISPPDDARYLNASLVNPLTEIASDGRTARVQRTGVSACGQRPLRNRLGGRGGVRCGGPRGGIPPLGGERTPAWGESSRSI